MPEMREAIVELSLFDEVAQTLKEKGVFARELSAKELSEIMQGVIDSLTAGQETIRASVPAMDVRIENSIGVIGGAVQVEKPIKATIGVNCTLANDTRRRQRIKLEKLNIKQKAGFAARIALKAVNIEGRAREKLEDPNRALGDALGTQLEPRGVKLTGIDLHFNENTLAVNLSGEPIEA